MGRINLKNLEKSYGKTKVIHDLSIDINEGELIVIVGPSGCGKTSFINAISGLVPKETGSVTVRGEEVTGPGPDRAMVFQDYALLPWRTVESNVRMPFEFQDLGVSEAEKNKRVQECLELVDLNGFEKSFPYELSGGMKQRVGIARALITHPDILLADEPFAAIDAMTREAMQGEMERIVMETGQTCVFITHSIDEAILLGDRVVVISYRPGKVKEIVDINFPRPRMSSSEVKTSREYAQIRDHIWKLVKDEASQTNRGE